jgi:transcriptional regulator with XRE-family HTH domain
MLHVEARTSVRVFSKASHPFLRKKFRVAGRFRFCKNTSSAIALFISDHYTGHMQAVFHFRHYSSRMAGIVSDLKILRLAAGISQRELARLIGERQSNLSYWERTGQIPRSDVLTAIAQALGVSVEELLGQPKPKRLQAPAGRARQLFEAISKLPRRQQDKILDVLEPFVQQHSGKHDEAA